MTLGIQIGCNSKLKTCFQEKNKSNNWKNFTCKECCQNSDKYLCCTRGRTLLPKCTGEQHYRTFKVKIISRNKINVSQSLGRILEILRSWVMLELPVYSENIQKNSPSPLTASYAILKDPLHSKNVFFLWLCCLKCPTLNVLTCMCAKSLERYFHVVLLKGKNASLVL